MGLFFNGFPSSHFFFLFLSFFLSFLFFSFLFFSFLFFSFLFFSFLFFSFPSLFFILCSLLLYSVPFLISYLLFLISYFLFLISYSVLIPILSFPLPLLRFSAKTNNPVLFLPLASPLLLPALFLCVSKEYHLTPLHHPFLITHCKCCFVVFSSSFFPFSIKNKRGEKLFIWGLVVSYPV